MVPECPSSDLHHWALGGIGGRWRMAFLPWATSPGTYRATSLGFIIEVPTPTQQPQFQTPGEGEQCDRPTD